jgi:hypothetical protein
MGHICLSHEARLFSRTRVCVAARNTQTHTHTHVHTTHTHTHTHTRARLIMPHITEDIGREFNFKRSRCVYMLPTNNTSVILSLRCTSTHLYELCGNCVHHPLPPSYPHSHQSQLPLMRHTHKNEKCIALKSSDRNYF